MKWLENKRLLISLIGLVFVGLYGIASIFYDSWWGLHHIAFLHPVLQVLFFALAIGSIAFFYFRPKSFPAFPLSKTWQKWLAFSLIAVLMGLLYYNFPFFNSYYGDSVAFKQNIGEKTTVLLPDYLDILLTSNFLEPKIGNITVIMSVRLLSYYLDITHTEVYKLIGMICGGLFILLWLWFVDYYFKNRKLKLLWMLIGVSAPFTQLFFGYEEIYTPSFPLMLSYLAVLLIYFRTRKAKWLWIMPVLILLCWRFHFISVLYIPSFLLAVLFHFSQKREQWKKYLTWKAVSIWLLLPFFLLGTFAYFFIFKDYADPRFVNLDVDIYTRMFLPLMEPEPPYDRYTLLHFNHFFDFFNMFFLWSSAVIFLLLVCFTFFRKKIKWNRPEVLTLGMTVVIFTMIYFAFNPLMSMPLDFDLYSLPALVVLMFGIVLTKQMEGELVQKIAGPVLAMIFMTIPIFIANANQKTFSHRLESVGIHVFKTYWIRSAGDIILGIESSGEDVQSKLERYHEVWEELKPWTNDGEDTEYAHLIFKIAQHYRKGVKDYEKALYCHYQVLRYNPRIEPNYVGLMECTFAMGRYSESYKHAKKLLEFGYPSRKRALRIALDCAIMANQYKDAMKYCEIYLSEWESEDVRTALEILESGRGVENLKAVIAKTQL